MFLLEGDIEGHTTSECTISINNIRMPTKCIEYNLVIFLRTGGCNTEGVPLLSNQLDLHGAQ